MGLKPNSRTDLTKTLKRAPQRAQRVLSPGLTRLGKLLPAALACILFQSCLPPLAQAENNHSLVINNARIFTADPRRPWASTMAVKDGRIIAIGDAVPTFIKVQQTVDAKGRLIMPGFHDCHIHLAEGAVELKQCRLNEAKSIDDVKRLLTTYLETQKDKPGQDENTDWLIAVGLPLPAVAGFERNFDHNFLDQVSQRPIIIYSEDAHSCWLNTSGIRLAGLKATSLAPCNGIIEKDEQGEPSGCLREGAMALAADHVPPTPLRQRVKALEEAVELANSLGITSIQDAHATDEVLDTYRVLARQGRLNLKVCAALHTGTLLSKAHYARLEKQRRHYTTGRLRACAAKIFADGVIETRTAALLEPYSDHPSWGNLNYSCEELDSMVRELDRRHFQIHIHAIGDRAVRNSLDALEKAVALNSPWPRRHLMAHLELVDGADMPRFYSSGVTPVCQFLWAFQDKYIKELTVPKLGERTWQVYPFKSLLDSGCHMAAGSDWTVSSMNPLEAMQVAVTRQSPTGEEKEAPLNEKQCIPLEAACKAYTTGGAWANDQDQTGSLECGKCADFIMLDRDIFNLPSREIGKTKVLATVIDGQVVYGSLNP